jgi:hypothetical protein
MDGASKSRIEQCGGKATMDSTDWIVMIFGRLDSEYCVTFTQFFDPHTQQHSDWWRWYFPL